MRTRLVIFILSCFIRAVHGLRRFVLGSAIFILALNNPSSFDRQFYRRTNKESRLAQLCPLLEFSFRGAWRWKDPSGSFSTSAYVTAFPGCIHYPPYLHAQMVSPSFCTPGHVVDHRPRQNAFDSSEPISDFRLDDPVDRPPAEKYGVEGIASQNDGYPIYSSDRQLFEDIWKKSFTDLQHFMNCAHQITPNIHLHYKLSQNIKSPLINRNRTLANVMALLPSSTKHILAVPLLGTAGGSEKISADLIKVLTPLYARGELAVVGPDDLFHMDTGSRGKFDIPLVAFNDVDADLTTEDRIDLFDRIMIEIRPRVLHTVNSDIAWLAMVQRGAQYAVHSSLYGSAYSDIRVDTLPVGAFWRYVPQVINSLTAVIVDNGSVATKAQAHFSFASSHAGKFVVLPSAFEIDRTEFPNPVAARATGRSLWLSRIAFEKRIDVLEAIARMAPDRQFDMYGAIIKGAFPVDLSWIDKVNNVTMRGRFVSLQDISVADYDSYVFTTSAEGLPIVLLEMTALGLPIIAPNVGGIGEFIDHDTGWLVSGPDAVDEYVSALAEIEAHPELVERRVRAARHRLQARHSFANFERTVRAIPGYIQNGE